MPEAISRQFAGFCSEKGGNRASTSTIACLLRSAEGEKRRGSSIALRRERPLLSHGHSSLTSGEGDTAWLLLCCCSLERAPRMVAHSFLNRMVAQNALARRRRWRFDPCAPRAHECVEKKTTGGAGTRKVPVKRHRGEPGHTRDTRDTKVPVKRGQVKSSQVNCLLRVRARAWGWLRVGLDANFRRVKGIFPEIISSLELAYFPEISLEFPWKCIMRWRRRRRQRRRRRRRLANEALLFGNSLPTHIIPS